MDKDDKAVLKGWVIGISGIIAFFLVFMNICILYKSHIEADLGCYKQAQHWQPDVDIGSVVALAFKDKYFSQYECDNFRNSIDDIGRIRDARHEAEQKKVIVSSIVKGN